MSPQSDLTKLKELIDALESEDAFDRRQAIEDLALLTHQHLDYRWRAAENDRARSVRKWRKWYKHEQRRQKTREIQSTVQLLAEGSSAPVNQQVLAQLLKVLPPDQAKQLMANLLAKVSGAKDLSMHPVCDNCAMRPATVSITSVGDDGHARNERLCEVCAIPHKP